MNDIGFAPHIHHHPGNPGDEHTKRLYELFAKVAEAEKAVRKAMQDTATKEDYARLAREKQNQAEALFKQAKKELAAALGGGPAPDPVRGEALSE